MDYNANIEKIATQLKTCLNKNDFEGAYTVVDKKVSDHNFSDVKKYIDLTKYKFDEDEDTNEKVLAKWQTPQSLKLALSYKIPLKKKIISGGKRRSMKKNKKTHRRNKKRHSRTQMRKRKSMSFW